MVAFLLPFSTVLGIEIKYRGGFSHHGARRVSGTVERHQWLELTFRPSMQTVVCDLWYEDSLPSGPRAEWLTMDIGEAYQTTMYPNGKLLLGARPAARPAPPQRGHERLE